MSRLDKSMILEILRKSNCIETPILNFYFMSVWVGESLKQQMDSSKRKLLNK